MAHWYVIRGGQEQGPITDQQLQELASTGALRPTHEVRQRGTGQLVMAAQVPGLVFGNKAAKPTPAARLPVMEPPPLPLTQPPPLPFMQPPPLPLPLQNDAAMPPARTPAKQSRLNPNITFLLGIWAGLGLCSAVFAFLAITGRFGPLVRWLETAAREKQSPQAKPEPPASSVTENTEKKQDGKTGSKAATSTTKLAAFKEVVKKYREFPDRFATESEIAHFNRELQKVQSDFFDVHFDPVANRQEAREIIEMYEQEIEGRYGGHLAMSLEEHIAMMYQTLRSN